LAIPGKDRQRSSDAGLDAHLVKPIAWIRCSRYSSSTILLVDDDDGLRDIAGDVLEECGYDVVPAGNGKQTIDYLRAASERPCLIILDLMMPIVNDWECLRFIKSEARFSSIPVILVTAIDRDRPLGADVVLKKPYAIAHLLAAVEALSARARAQMSLQSP
jgi:DNA-binding response OmpR family regulator